MTLKVIGAGFGRTGTTTLKWALETLLGAVSWAIAPISAPLALGLRALGR